MTVQVATNGTLVTAELARWLREVEADVQVSLDGSCPAIHDSMRAGSDAFTMAVAGIRALTGAGMAITVGTVVTRANLHDIPAIMALCVELGVVSYRLIPFVPAGRGEHNPTLEVTPHEMRRLTREIHARRTSSQLNIAPMEFEETLDGSFCPDPRNVTPERGCSGALAYGTITPTGELLPCHFFEGVRADNVAHRPFAEIWARSRFLNYFRQLDVTDLHGDCPTCPFVGHCGGSCRARNFAKGDLFGSNPGCWVLRHQSAEEVL
jgi:radical SAM protein with 4Fe4S-binding SPASM domain